MSTSTSSSVSCPYVKICLCVLFILATGASSPLDQKLQQQQQQQQQSSINSLTAASPTGHVSKVVTPALPHYESSNQPSDAHLMEDTNDFEGKSIGNEYSHQSSLSKVESHLANLLGCTSLLTQDLTALLASQPNILSDALQLYTDQNGFDKTKILLHSALGDKVSIIISSHSSRIKPVETTPENVLATSDEVVDEVEQQQQQQQRQQQQQQRQQQQQQTQLQPNQQQHRPPKESAEQMDLNSLRVTLPSDSSSEELPLQISPVSSSDDLRLIDVPVNLNSGNSHSRVDGSKENTGVKVLDHSILLPHKEDGFLFIPRMRMIPMMPFGSRVKIVARNKILAEMKIPVTPYMGVFEALKQVENRVPGGSKHNSRGGKWIQFALATDEVSAECYAIHSIGRITADQGHFWNIRVTTVNGLVTYEGECIPNDKSVVVTPSSVIELQFSSRKLDR